MPAFNVTSVYGDGAVGKSLILAQLAASTVRGTPWFGLDPRQGRCLLFTAEDEFDETWRRLEAIGRHEGCEVSDMAGLTVLPLAGKDALLAVPDRATRTLKPTPLFRELAAWIREWRPALVILDTLADIYGGDEIDRAQVRQFVGMLRGLAIDHRTTIIIAAHPSLSGMNSGSGTSGSTAWNNSVRSRLYVTRDDASDTPDEDIRVIEGMKANYSRRGFKIRVRWREGVFVEDDQSPGASTVMEQKIEELFLQLLDAHTAEGRAPSVKRAVTYAPAVFAKDPRCQGVPKAALEAAMGRLFAKGSIKSVEVGSPSKPRSKIVRAGP
jgi:RecA-family ATPase